MNNYNLKVNNLDIAPYKTKIFPSASKEWRNSACFYDTNNIIDLPIKDKIANKFIKTHFNMMIRPKPTTKSRRMLTLGQRLSANRLLVTKPEIKQNNDKAIINVHIFSVEKLINIGMLQELALSLREQENDVTKNLLKSDFNEKAIDFKKANILISMLKKIKLSEKPLNFYLNLVARLVTHSASKVHTHFLFQFFAWALTMFNIKIKKTVSQDKKVYTHRLYAVYDNLEKLLFKSKTFDLDFSYTDEHKAVIRLRRLLEACIKQVSSKLSVHWLLKYYLSIYNIKASYLDTEELFAEQDEIMTYISNLQQEQAKISKLLPLLKTYLKKVYDKKIELNIVRQKYMHMDIDILTQAISVKLKDKKVSPSELLENAVYLAGIPKLNRTPKYLEPSLDLNKNQDRLYKLTYEMFTWGKIQNMSSFSTNINYLLSLTNYKSTTGIRLQVSGRLTRRYTAARALKNLIWRGGSKYLENLKGMHKLINKIDFLDKIDLEKVSPKVYMPRNEIKANVQYSFAHSSRRIGAFGIKGWLSGS